MAPHSTPSRCAMRLVDAYVDRSVDVDRNGQPIDEGCGFEHEECAGSQPWAVCERALKGRAIRRRLCGSGPVEVLRRPHTPEGTVQVRGGEAPWSEPGGARIPNAEGDAEVLGDGH
ncbi:hypothetical protein GCM10023087_08900 [Microbacterium rhizosphaerae]